MTVFTESVIEEAVLEYLASRGWQVVFGPEIAPGEPGAERGDYSEALQTGRLVLDGGQSLEIRDLPGLVGAKAKIVLEIDIEVPEWLNGTVSKTVVGLVSTVGSNPTLSA